MLKHTFQTCRWRQVKVVVEEHGIDNFLLHVKAAIGAHPLIRIKIPTDAPGRRSPPFVAREGLAFETKRPQTLIPET